MNQNRVDDEHLLQMDFDLCYLFYKHFAFNSAASTHACAGYSPFSLLRISSKHGSTIILFRHSLAWYAQSTTYFLIDDALRSAIRQLPFQPCQMV